MRNLELTFALIKPHIFKNTYAFRDIENLMRSEFTIVKSREVVMTKEIAHNFYKEHESKFFYNRLLTFVCSGPSFAYILASENCIAKWRKLMGPTKVFQTVYSHPGSIRGKFGISDTRNACHGSDGPESAESEISLIFPDFSFDEWRKRQEKVKRKN